MSEINTVKSSGILKLIDGKKYRGQLVAGETGAAFYTKGKSEPVVEWHYTRLHRMDNIRRGGTSTQLTVILKDDSRYVFELDQGLKVYNHMDKLWADKPVTPRTRADELHRLAELRGETVQKPKKHLITRRHPNRSIAGDIGIYLLLIIVGFAMVFPLIFLIGSSLKPLDELFRFPPTVWPNHPTSDNFSDLFVTMGQSWIPFSRYLINTVLITFVGTFGHLIIASMAAFVLAKYDFPGGKMFFAVVTTCLMFSGYVTGIPNYLLMQKLNLLDNPLVLILPGCLSVYNMIIMRSFFYGIPDSLRESAQIDGAGLIRIMMVIYIPLSKPVFASLALFYAVGRWNGYGDALMYIKNEKQWFPLQLLLYNILNNVNAVEVAAQEGFMQPGLKESLKSAIVMFSTVPILLIYPWLQRYFIAGVTMGAVKE